MAMDIDKLGAYINSFAKKGIGSPKDPDEASIIKYKNEFPLEAMEKMQESNSEVFSDAILQPSTESSSSQSQEDLTADASGAENLGASESQKEETTETPQEFSNKLDLGLDSNSKTVYEDNKEFFNAPSPSLNDEVLDLNLDSINLDESLIDTGEEINQDSPFANLPESESLSQTVESAQEEMKEEPSFEEADKSLEETKDEGWAADEMEVEKERAYREFSRDDFNEEEPVTLDEQPNSRFNERQNFPRSFSEEEEERIAEANLEDYSERARMILLKVFEENLLDDHEKESVTKMIAQRTEPEVIRLIGEYLSKKSLIDRRRIAQKDAGKIFSYSIISLIGFFILLGGYLFTKNYVNAYYYYSRGLKELADEKFYEAEEDYNRGMSSFRSVKMTNRFAKQYEDFRRYDDALMKYMRSLEIDPKNILSNLGLIELYYKRQEYDKSLNLVQDNLKTHPSDFGLWFWLGRNYLVKGKSSDDYLKASKIFESLAGRTSELEQLRALSFLTVAYAYLDDFKKARGVNQYLESKDSSYVNKGAHPEYYRYLLDYFRKNFYGKKMYTKNEQEKEGNQLYTVYTLERLGKKMEDHLENKEDFYGSVAMWFLLNKDYDKAKVLLNDGFASFENRGYQVDTKEMDLANGILNYYLNNQEESIKSFQKVLETDKNDPYANYYLGNVNLSLLNDPERASFYYTEAISHWNDMEYKEYADLLYRTGYAYYTMGKAKNNQEGAKDIYDSLYWFLKYSEKAPEEQPKISYIKGNIFLRLKNYDLALVEYQNSLDSLEPFMEYYTSKEGDVDEDVKNKLKILSDVYNNMGVADVSKYYISSDMSYKVKALNNFINSIDLKNNLSVLKGKPSVNFSMLSRSNTQYGANSFIMSDDFESLALN